MRQKRGEEKRREARREEKTDRSEEAGRAERGTSERTGIARAAIARSVSLASVSAWLRPTFLHLAGERPLRFFVPRLSVSFHREASPFSARLGTRNSREGCRVRKSCGKFFAESGHVYEKLGKLSHCVIRSNESIKENQRTSSKLCACVCYRRIIHIFNK